MTQAETSQLIQSVNSTRSLRAASEEEKKQVNETPPALHQTSAVCGEHQQTVKLVRVGVQPEQEEPKGFGTVVTTG